MKISVIIPVLHGGQPFQICLSSIRESIRKPDELIAVVDGDDPDSASIAQEFTDQVIVYPTTHGPAYARNQGVEQATGEIVIFFDADITVHPDTIQKIEQYFEQHTDISALIGSYDDTPAAPNFLSQYKNLVHHYVHQTSKRDAATFWGACGAIRRDVFLQIGGFDVRYTRPCIEDIELGYRLTAKHYTIHLVADIQVKHHKSWTSTKLLQSDIRDRAIPWSHLILTQDRLINDLNIDTKSRLSTIIVYLLILTIFVATLMPPVLGLVIIWIGILLGLNRQIYTFLYLKRGTRFLVVSLFWHWLYFLYSGLSFVGVWIAVHLETDAMEQK